MKLYYGSLFLAASLTVLLILFAWDGNTHEMQEFDEAAHFVSSVMVMDYLKHGLWEGVSPMTFARNYYDHYPKVAIGHWPPLFYLCQALWFLVAGVSRVSVMIFTSGIAAGIAVVTAVLCRMHSLGWRLSLVMGGLAALNTVLLRSTIDLSSDPMTALATILAALVCALWLENLSFRWGLAYAGIASLAVLVKGNAFLVYLLPALVVFSPGGWRSALRREFWLPVLLSLVFPLAWYAQFLDLATGEVIPGGKGSNPYYWRLIRISGFNLWNLWIVNGALICVLALASLKSSIGERWYLRYPAVSAMPVAAWIFLSWMTPHNEGRLMLATIPVFYLAAAMTMRKLPVYVSVVLCGALALSVAAPRAPQEPHGWVGTVNHLKSSGSKTILIGSNRSGEGAIVAEFAMRSPKPEVRILRAGKVLQKSDWMGYHVQRLVQSPEDVGHVLADAKVDTVVVDVDTSQPVPPTLALLRRAVDTWPVAHRAGLIQIRRRPN